MRLQSLLLFGAALLSPVAAQFGGWKEGQVNTSICTWHQMRAALIRDTIYLDGGAFLWMPGWEDGSVGSAEPESGFQRLVLSFNLSHPVDTDTNVTALLFENTIKRPHSSTGAHFEDGAMLSNDNQFILFGGNIRRQTQNYEPPDGDEVLGFQLYRQGVERLWEDNWDDVALGDDVNRYITYGGAASAPSENKAWYFSGMTSPTGGEIEIGLLSEETNAQNVSNRLIEVDMSTQSMEVWSNSSLPRAVEGRAGSELVWVPVGDEGILVVLGGVTYPQWVTPNSQSEDPEASEEESPVFMEDIDIYDVASRNWYKQPTSGGGPGARTRGCAVLGTASDQSSFNIYYYGGFNGIDAVEPYADDVWVLSMPSFTWTRLNNGTESHARSGHKCFTPYSDQMLVVGGHRPLVGVGRSCLDPGPFVFFNLSSGQWMDSYHPEEYSDYGVPDMVVEKIGGDASGGATLTAPEPSGWADDDLGDVFSQPYDTSKIAAWGPFPVIETPTGDPGDGGDDDDEDGGGGGGGLPSWVAPVLGVVLGLMALTAALVVFFLWRKRKIFTRDPNSAVSDTSTEDTGKRIRAWMRGQPASRQPAIVEKAPTVTSSEETGTTTSPEMRSVSAMNTHPYPSPPLPDTFEAQGNPIAELPDSPARAELSDGGSSIRRYTLTDPSRNSFRGPGENNSTVSGPSATGPVGAEQAESPVAPNHGHYRTSDPGHMRSMSETLAGPGAGAFAAEQRPPIGSRQPSDQVSDLVSPPTSPPLRGELGEDYMTFNSWASPNPDNARRSVFREEDEDLQRK